MCAERALLVFPPLGKGGQGGFADVGASATLGKIPLDPPLIKGEATHANVCRFIVGIRPWGAE
jgi:hypothetical protein